MSWILLCLYGDWAERHGGKTRGVKSNLKPGRPRIFWIRIMTKSKRVERGSISSSVSSNTELKKARMNEQEEEKNSLRDLIQNLTANMESNFAKLHEELCGLTQEMKE